MTNPASPAIPGLGLNFQTKQEAAELNEQGQRECWITILALTAVLVVMFADSLWRTLQMWFQPQYQFGFVIPIIGAILIWTRRQSFREVPASQRWIGVGLIVLGMAMRVAGGLMTIVVLDNWAFIPCLMGIFVLVGGLATVRWAGPAILFLILMYPFPRSIEQRIMFPLQKLATKASTVALVTMGVDAFHSGDTQIVLSTRPTPMNVAEQCSGLRMLTVFTAMAVAFALFATERPWWERVVIVLSAFPISVMVNVIRIALTGLLLTILDTWDITAPLLEKGAHDFAGVFMMPLALGLLYLVFQVLKHILIETPQDARPVTMHGTST